MISLAGQNDIVRLKELWTKCFDEPEAYASYYFDNCFSVFDTLVIRERGEAVSMLTLMKVSLASLNGDGVSSEGYYIYAAATHPDFQRRGLMGLLLAQAEEYAVSRGALFTCLIPATAGLFGFYGRFGYSVCCRKYDVDLSAGKIPADSFNSGASDQSARLLPARNGAQTSKLQPLPYEDFHNAHFAYLDTLKAPLLHSSDMLRRVYDEIFHYGGCICRVGVPAQAADPGGSLMDCSMPEMRAPLYYAACQPDGNALLIRETNIPKEGYAALCRLAQTFGMERAVVRETVIENEGAPGTGASADAALRRGSVPYGMVKWLQPHKMQGCGFHMKLMPD